MAGTLQDVAHEAGWESATSPGKWMAITRAFRDGSTQQWWAVEVIAGPYGPDKVQRAVVATTDPETLPDLTTWYLVTNLPAPTEPPMTSLPFPPASLEEVIRLYGLRQWVEQGYKQVKHALGWSQYQVRSDQAMRRHWQLVYCAFSFCWYHASHGSAKASSGPQEEDEPDVSPQMKVQTSVAGTREKNPRGKKECARRSPGRWRSGRSAPGWSLGSCSGAIGRDGHHCPHLLRYTSFLNGSHKDTLWRSTVLLDPSSTKYR